MGASAVVAVADSLGEMEVLVALVVAHTSRMEPREREDSGAVTAVSSLAVEEEEVVVVAGPLLGERCLFRIMEHSRCKIPHLEEIRL
jgi:hypothetical protein